MIFRITKNKTKCFKFHVKTYYDSITAVIGSKVQTINN
jgi:hypothetical protein